MTRSLQHVFDQTLGFTEQALEHIRAGEGSELELQKLRAYLLDILAAIERNPGVEAACDDLYASAKELALGGDRGRRMALLPVSTGRCGPGWRRAGSGTHEGRDRARHEIDGVHVREPARTCQPAVQIGCPRLYSG